LLEEWAAILSPTGFMLLEQDYYSIQYAMMHALGKAKSSSMNNVPVGLLLLP
jgi:hypothetical protein